MYLNRFSPENHEILGSHHHKSGEFVTQDPLQVVDLFYGDAYPHAVYTRLDEHFFPAVPANLNGREQQLLARPDFHLWLVVLLNYLRGEVL